MRKCLPLTPHERLRNLSNTRWFAFYFINTAFFLSGKIGLLFQFFTAQGAIKQLIRKQLTASMIASVEKHAFGCTENITIKGFNATIGKIKHVEIYMIQPSTSKDKIGNYYIFFSEHKTYRNGRALLNHYGVP